MYRAAPVDLKVSSIPNCRRDCLFTMCFGPVIGRVTHLSDWNVVCGNVVIDEDISDTAVSQATPSKN